MRFFNQESLVENLNLYPCFMIVNTIYDRASTILSIVI